MINLTIASEQFEHVGFRPHFDGDQYDALLDTLSPEPIPTGKPLPTVNLAPWPPLLTRSPIGTVIKGLRHQTRSYGNYSSPDATIQIFVPDNEKQANQTLLHETWHWAEDAAGILPPQEEIARYLRHRFLPYLGACLPISTGIGAATYEALQPSVFATPGAILAGSLCTLAFAPAIYYHAYRNSPWERSAQKFAAKPEILREFGRIITIEQL